MPRKKTETQEVNVIDEQVSIDVLDFHKTLKKLEKKIINNAGPVFDKIIDMALKGDRFALKLFADKTIPNRDVRLLTVNITSLESLEDVKKVEENILRKVFYGEFSYEEGKGLLSLLGNYKETLITLNYANKFDVIQANATDVTPKMAE